MVKGGTEGGDRASPTKYKGRTGEFQIKSVVQFVNTKRLFGWLCSNQSVSYPN